MLVDADSKVGVSDGRGGCQVTNERARAYLQQRWARAGVHCIELVEDAHGQEGVRQRLDEVRRDHVASMPGSAVVGNLVGVAPNVALELVDRPSQGSSPVASELARPMPANPQPFTLNARWGNPTKIRGKESGCAADGAMRSHTLTCAHLPPGNWEPTRHDARPIADEEHVGVALGSPR